MVLAPKLKIRKKRYLNSWRICPYSTCDTVTNRIPAIEQSNHTTTSGYMQMYLKDGHLPGWICKDPACSYYTGSASTEVAIEGRDVVINRETGEYRVIVISGFNPICSGMFFFEA